MNRRSFLQNTAILGAAGWLARSSLLAQSQPAPLGVFHPLRRNVGYFTGRGGTIGWLADPSALVVVDTQFPATATFCLDGLPGRMDRQLDVVLNTHHHGDHTSGNGVFREVTKTIVAQENVPGLQMASAARSGGGKTPVMANETFAKSWRREIGDEVVTATYFGSAHTNGDAIVHFERANVVHMGDLVFNRLYPYVNLVDGASLAHWITVLEKAVKVYPGDAIYLCGHGKDGFGVEYARGDILVFCDYLNGLLAYVEQQIAAGKSKDEITALDNLPGFPEFHSAGPNRLSGNLATAFDELTTSKG